MKQFNFLQQVKQNLILTLLTLLFSFSFSFSATAQCGQLLNGDLEGQREQAPEHWSTIADGGFAGLYDPVTALGGNYSENGGRAMALYVNSSNDYAEFSTTLSGLTIGNAYTVSWEENVIAGYATHAGYTVSTGSCSNQYGNIASYAWAKRKLKFVANSTEQALNFRLEGAMKNTYLLIDGVELTCSKAFTVCSITNGSMHGNYGEQPVGWEIKEKSASIASYDPQHVFGISYSLDGGAVTTFFVDAPNDYAHLSAKLENLEPGQVYKLYWLVNVLPGYEENCTYSVQAGNFSADFQETASFQWHRKEMVFTAEDTMHTVSFQLNGAKGGSYLLLDGLNLQKGPEVSYAPVFNSYIITNEEEKME